MTKLLVTLISFVFASVVSAQNIIVSPQWLKEHQNDPNLVILYTGFVIQPDFYKEHIAGSRFLWPEWLAHNTPEANMVQADKERATKVLQDLGINKSSKVVVVHRGADVTIASRMFLALENYGLKDKVYFLNGGMEAWKKAGYPVTDQPSVYKKGDFVATDNGLLVDVEYVQKALHNASSEVIDARAKRWYDGDATGYPRDGHISGAKNIPYPDMIDADNAFKSADVLGQQFSSVVPDRKKELVLYCFIGQTACVDYLAARELGYRVKLYDGSMQEWSRNEELPMEKTKKD